MRELGLARVTSWSVMRFNSLVRLIFFGLNRSSFLVRFRAVVGVVVGAEQEFDVWLAQGLAARFASEFDLGLIFRPRIVTRRSAGGVLGR
jgi:hypothetical protein